MNTLWRPYCGSLMVGLLIATSPSAWRFYDVMYYQMESLENILLNVKGKVPQCGGWEGGHRSQYVLPTSGLFTVLERVKMSIGNVNSLTKSNKNIIARARI